MLLTAGCADQTAETVAEAHLKDSIRQLNTYKSEIRRLPGLQSEVREARERIAQLEKERDALKKAGHR